MVNVAIAPAGPGRGILLMLGAVLAFSVMDAFAKGVAVRSDPWMAIWARYLGQALIGVALLAPRGRDLFHTRHPGLQLLRSIFLLCATTFFFFGISRIGLAEATAIMDVHPVLITLGGALFLGERFGPRRAAGVLAALVGALVIIRPGTAVFSPWALLPLCAAVSFTAYALATRVVGRDEHAWTSLLYATLVGAVLLTLALPLLWIPPDMVTATMMLGLGSIGAAGQWMLIRALAAAEAGLVAPFAYVGLIFAGLWGALFFNELPDGPTYVGALIIVAAGLFVWRAERAV